MVSVSIICTRVVYLIHLFFPNVFLYQFTGNGKIEHRFTNFVNPYYHLEL